MDGGSRTQYYWSGEDGILYHTEKDEDMVVPFFNSVDEAERFLEHQAESNGKDRYSGLVLRKTGNRKVEEATDVLTEQSGLMEFSPDGGYESPWPRHGEYTVAHRKLERDFEEGLEYGHGFVDGSEGRIRYDQFTYSPMYHINAARKAHWEIFNEFEEEVEGDEWLSEEEKAELFVRKLGEEFDQRVEEILESDEGIGFIPILKDRVREEKD